jgi:hypothetical protein
MAAQQALAQSADASLTVFSSTTTNHPYFNPKIKISASSASRAQRAVNI